MRYLRIPPESDLLPYDGARPFLAIVAIEEPVSSSWQWEMSKWLIESGCTYMMAWGINCSSWDDSVDYAQIDIYLPDDVPEDKHVLTTWHENESLGEVFDFAKRHAKPGDDTVQFRDTVLFHISKTDKKRQFETLYAVA